MAIYYAWLLVSAVMQRPLRTLLSWASDEVTYVQFCRWRADKAANARPATVLRRGRRQQVTSADITVGDIIYLKANEEVRVRGRVT
jgi:hypothetical protein